MKTKLQRTNTYHTPAIDAPSSPIKRYIKRQYTNHNKFFEVVAGKTDEKVEQIKIGNIKIYFYLFIK